MLPTARSARFSSGLGVLDFMKRTSILKCGPEQLAKLGPSPIALGEAEGLEAHARSVAIRLIAGATFLANLQNVAKDVARWIC